MDSVNAGKSHNITINNRKFASLSGVTKVVSVCPEQVVLITAQGRFKMTGRDIHVVSLNMEQGKLELEGDIDGVVWQKDKGLDGNLVKRLFK